MVHDVEYIFPDDLDDALRYHGLTREQMRSELIQWVGSVKLESPELFEVFLEGPEDIESIIDRYDFVFSTGMTVDYPVRRRWSGWMALREFVQNALDVEEDIFGYDHIMVNVEKTDNRLIIRDRGPGIELDAFKLGGSDKGCADRGYFGEGLKVAIAYFESRGSHTYIFTRNGQVFKSVKSPDSGLVLILVGRYDTDKFPLYEYGTAVYIDGVRIEDDAINLMVFKNYVEHNEGLSVVSVQNLKTKECPYDKPNIIICNELQVEEDKWIGEPLNKLWVRDIFVNRISSISGKKSIFGYNLWWVDLEPNRVGVASPYELSKEVASAFTPEAIIKLLNYSDLIDEATNTINIQYYETSHVDWYFASDQVKYEVAKWVEENGYCVADDRSSAKWYEYLGLKVLTIPETIKSLFVYARKAEDAAKERLNKDKEDAETGVCDERTLTVNERCVLAAIRHMITGLQYKLLKHIKPPQVFITEKGEDFSGMQYGDIIYLTRDRIRRGPIRDALSTAFHEYGHYYGRQRYGLASDVSKEFERGLSNIGGALADLSAYDRFGLTMRRAQEGYINAHMYVWDSEYEEGTIRERDWIAGELVDEIPEIMAYKGKLITNQNEMRGDIMSCARLIEEFPPVALVIPFDKKDEVAYRFSSGEVYGLLNRFSRAQFVLSKDAPYIREVYMDKVREEVEICKQLGKNKYKSYLVFIFDLESDKYIYSDELSNV